MRLFSGSPTFAPRTVRIFFASLLMTLIAKGAAFFPAYSIDDYFLILQRPPSAPMLRQGRFGQAALSELLYLLQLEPAYATVFFVAFSIFTSALLATLIVRYWSLDRRGWLPVAVACFAVNHPYTTEIFTFRTALGSSMVALALFSLLLIPRRWSARHLVAGSVLFGFLLSIYQIVLHYCLMIVAMGAAIWLARYLTIGAADGWSDRVRSLLSPQRVLRHRNTALLCCAAAGTAGYLALAAVVFSLPGVVRVERSNFIPLGMLAERGELVLDVLKFRFLAASPLMTRFTKNMLLLLLLGALAGLLWRTRPWRWPRASMLLLAVYVLLAGSLVWSVGIIMFLVEFWPAPRIMSHVGIFWAGLLAIAFRCFGARMRKVLAVMSVLILLSFVGASNRVLRDQARLNARDALKASRIVARLEMQPGFSEMAFVALIGKALGYYPLVYPTTDHDMNISALAPDWSRLAVLRELSGYDLKPAADEAQWNAAAAYCQKVKPWPGPESVAIQGRLAIICLGPSQ
jgi:Glucosyl transferase GtrII